MLQPDASLPAVPLQPAPWLLRGQGWIVALQLPAGASARDAFLPAAMHGRGRGPALLMFVDYTQSGCGPYHELLFIPGAFPFADGRSHMTISRILVSTWDSVVNGRRNWGIPKDRADFSIDYGGNDDREDRIRVFQGERTLAELHLRACGLSLPVFAGLVPASLRTLAQRHAGNDYFYAPSSSGRVRAGKVLSWRFDGELFPDLADARVLAAAKIPSFRMRFPVARTLPSG